MEGIPAHSRGLAWVIFKVPSNPTHAMVLGCDDSACLEIKGSLICGLWVKLLREKLWLKRYFVAILCPAVKSSVGPEVYHEQQLSKEEPTQTGFHHMEGRGLGCAEQRGFSYWCGLFSPLPRHLTR